MSSTDSGSNKRVWALKKINLEIMRASKVEEFRNINVLLAKAQKQLARGHHKAALSSLKDVAVEAKRMADDIARAHGAEGARPSRRT